MLGITVYWDQNLSCESAHTEFVDSTDNDLQDSHNMILQVWQTD